MATTPILDLIYRLFLERDTSTAKREAEAVVGQDYSDDVPRVYHIDYGSALVSYETMDGSLVKDKMICTGAYGIRVRRWIAITPFPEKIGNGSMRTPKVWVVW